jgi:multiple sugar transport system substrate-binding protein
MAVGTVRCGLCGVLAVLLVVAGCGRGADVADRYDQEGPIYFADGPDTSSGRQIEELVKKWNRAHPDEKVYFKEMSYPTDDYRAQLRARAQDLALADPDDHPRQCYDVMAMDVIWTTEFAEAGYLLPLDAAEVDVDRFLRQPVRAATVDGRLWAVPWRADAGLLYYRRDLLEKAGKQPPRTWEELVEQAESVPREDVAGYVGQLARFEGLTVNAVEWIWGAGGSVFDQDGSVAVGAAPAREGIRRLVRGVKDGWIPGAALGHNEEGSRQAFQQGSALFMRNWPYVYPLLADKDSPVHDRFGVAPLPGPSALGGWNLGISSCSTHRRTAREFIAFLTSEDNQRHLFEKAGFGPTIAAVYDDPDLRRRFPYLEVLGDSLRDSRNRPATPQYEDVSDAIQEHVSDALSEVDSADDRIDDLAEELEVITGG